MTLRELEQLQQEARKRREGYSKSILVCTGTACVANRSTGLVDRLRGELIKRDLSEKYLIVPSGCLGLCAEGPLMMVQPDGVLYTRVGEDDIPDIITGHLEAGEPVERLMYRSDGKICPRMENIPFFDKQQLLALRNRTLVDPERIDDYLGIGGYQTFAKVAEGMDPEQVVEAVVRSGLRGRGGAGFPTGLKWRSCREAAGKAGAAPYIVCNADEGDPGAFMDESIIESDPHSVLEGMLIGAYAIGAREGYVYIRKEYPLALKRLSRAIDQARDRGLLGENVLGTGLDFDVHVHRGAGSFVCGESSALMASMAGLPGEPRAKYIRSVERGFRDRPTVLNNVETFANVPLIMEKGPEWFASIGTGDVSEDPWGGSTGTKVFALVGYVRNTGLVEVPMGTTLREIIFDIGGGMEEGRSFKAVQTGGPSGGVLPEASLDLPVDFDSLSEAGSMMGSGGMVVMDRRTCMVQVAKYFVDFLQDESCGKCTPCREGLVAMSSILGRITRGEGREGDIELLEEYGRTMTECSLCGLGKSAANPVLSTIRYFREEYGAHIGEGRCPAGSCRSLISYSIDPDSCTGCTACAGVCPVDAISGEPGETHAIDDDACIRCGMCEDVCRFDAVEVR
jgi:NADH-quinone oxidoreductase subunit F